MDESVIIVSSDSEDENEGGSNSSILQELDKKTSDDTQIGNSSKQVEVSSVQSEISKPIQSVCTYELQRMAEHLAHIIYQNNSGEFNEPEKVSSNEQPSNSEHEDINTENNNTYSISNSNLPYNSLSLNGEEKKPSRKRGWRKNPSLTKSNDECILPEERNITNISEQIKPKKKRGRILKPKRGRKPMCVVDEIQRDTDLMAAGHIEVNVEQTENRRKSGLTMPLEGPKPNPLINSINSKISVLEEVEDNSINQLACIVDNKGGGDESVCSVSPSQKSVNKGISDSERNSNVVSLQDISVNLRSSSIDLSSSDVVQLKSEFVESYRKFFNEDTEDKCRTMGDFLQLAMVEVRNFTERVNASHRLTSDKIRSKEIKIAKQHYQNLMVQYRRAFMNCFVYLHKKIISPQIIFSWQKNLMVAIFLKVFLRAVSLKPEFSDCIHDAKLRFIDLITKVVFNNPLVFMVFSCNETTFKQNCHLVLEFMKDCSNVDSTPISEENKNSDNVEFENGVINVNLSKNNVSYDKKDKCEPPLLSTISLAACEKKRLIMQCTNSTNRNLDNTSIGNVEGIDLSMNSKLKKTSTDQYEAENKKEEYQTVGNYNKECQNKQTPGILDSNSVIKHTKHETQMYVNNTNQPHTKSFTSWNRLVKIEQLNRSNSILMKKNCLVQLKKTDVPEKNISSVKYSEKMLILSKEKQNSNITALKRTCSNGGHFTIPINKDVVVGTLTQDEQKFDYLINTNSKVVKVIPHTIATENVQE